MLKLKKAKCFLLFCCWLLFPCSPVYGSTGVIVALNESLIQLQQEIENTQVFEKANRTFYQGEMAGEAIVAVRSPMGLVNNAITTQTLIASFSVKQIISISPAGGIDDAITPGDLILATNVYQHDFGTFKPYGFIWGKVPNGSNLDYLSTPLEMRKSTFNAAKPFLGNKNKLVEGVVVSGDQFVADETKRKWLSKKFHALGVDMGASSILQVCHTNRTPCLILRVVTDKASSSARSDFENALFGYQTSIKVVPLISEILHQLAEYGCENQ